MSEQESKKEKESQRLIEETRKEGITIDDDLRDDIYKDAQPKPSDGDGNKNR
jgi:hypothetical protein